MYPKIAYSWIQKFIRKGLIKVNSQRYKYDQKITGNDIISIPKFFLEEIKYQSSKIVNKKIIPKKLLLETKTILKESIVYKDENFIIINKPVGLAVQGGTKVNISIADCLDCFQFKYANIPHIVHRLDKDTSGILLIARTKEVATKISSMLTNNQIEKIYHAIAYDNLLEDEFTIKQPLSKSLDNYEIMEINYNGKDAITKFKVVSRNKKFKVALVAAQLETGRKHQIRAHLALGCQSPILGDFKYGYKKVKCDHSVYIPRIMLHSFSIRFSYDNKIIFVKADCPEDFKNVSSYFGLE